MQQRRRSAQELTEELKRLEETSAGDRDRVTLLHEISVYQEELVVQNEALMRAQSALEDTRDRYIELYDFAPNGYLTLDEHGLIKQCNLTIATFLGRSKSALEGLPLLGFVVPDDRPEYFAFLRRCRNGYAAPAAQTDCELSLRAGDYVRKVQLMCRPRRTADGTRDYFVSLIDVTEPRQLEQERASIAREHAALVSRLLSFQDDERKRIARDLHDDIGQQVTALRLRLQDLTSRLADQPVRDDLSGVQEVIETLDRRVHFVASELRPAALDLGVATAIEQFVREWSSTYGIRADFHSDGIGCTSLGAEIDTHFYRVVQEALNNVSKHAGAGSVTVLLERRSDDVVLIVEDDGRGFDARTVRQEGQGLGLVGMRERAQIVGGRLEIDTSPGNGTSVFLHIPNGFTPPPARPAR